MSTSFLNFVLSLEQQQTQRRGGAPTEEDGPSGAPSPAAVAAAAAAPPRRPPSRVPLPAGDLAPAGDAAPSPAALDRAVAAAASRVGPQLRALRDEQRAQGTGARETYSMDHVARLEMFPPAVPYQRARANVLCSKAHPQPCPYGCKTCHFCRQRTTEAKSVCSRCDGAADVVGGPARGYWCGSCLWLRIGENLDEVRDRSDWVCPGCRGVCNCSGANCMRLKQGWFPTNQLAHEARDQGFRSVAHYLVLTNVAERRSAAAIGADADGGRRVAMSRQAPPSEGVGRPAKRQRTLLEVGGLHGRDAVLAAAAANSKLLSEVAAVLEEINGGGGAGSRGGSGAVRRRGGFSALGLLLGGEASGETQGERAAAGSDGGGAAAAAGGFLGILDADLMDDDDEGGAGGASRAAAVAPLPRRGVSTARAAPAAASSRTNPAFTDPDALPPRRPPPRVRDTSSPAELASPPPPLAPLVDEGEARLRRLVGGIDIEQGPHAGLPGAPGAVGTRAVARGTGERAPRLAIPGWDLPNRRGPRQRDDEEAVAAAEGGQRRFVEAVRCVGVEEEVTEAMEEDSGGAVAPAVTPEVAAPPATAPAETTTRTGPPTTATEPADPADPFEEVIPATQPQGDEEEAAVVAAAGAEVAAALPPEPCTDAHTDLAAAAASLPPDAFAWNALALRASGAVHDVHAMYRHHPDAPSYVEPLMGAAVDVPAYEAAFDAGIAALKGVLRDAEALLGETVAVPAPDDDDGSVHHCAGALRSYAGLRKAVELLTYLARLLPDEDVRWRVERRLLGAEPFVEFAASDPSTRAILLRHALLELLAVLHRKGLPTRNAAVATSAALTTIARDLAAALPVLSAVKDGEPLPESDFCVGPWRYDADTRRLRRPIEIFQELGDAYLNLSAMLIKGLQWVTDLCKVLGIAGAAFLTPELVAATLGPDARLTGATKKEALALVSTVLDVASPAADAASYLNMTGAERDTLTAARAAVCDVLESSVVPALEAMVHRDFPLWGSSTSVAAASAGGDIDPAERVGGEKVETLARCYAFLVACGRPGWGWGTVEGKATEPYAFARYWSTANAAYRHFSTFLLAHALAHAPSVLSVPQFAASMLKVWTQALVDTGGRRSAWYLTSVLAGAAPQGLTAPLFAGLPPEALDIRGDVSGEKRAALMGHVARAIVKPLCPLQSKALMALGDLDALMVARLAEIERSAFDPRASGLRYQAVAARVAVSVASALAPTELMPGAVSAANLGGMAARLLRRAAEWAVAACAAAQADHSKGSGGGGGDADVAALELADPLSTVADARQRLAESAFAQVPELIGVLLDAGAPESLERSGPSGATAGTPPPLLESLWVLLGGAIEAGSGAEKPSPVDTSMYEALADALGGPGGSDHPAPQRRQQLLSYVLGTFVRRYLQRSSLRHASHERAAVNALRLVRAAMAGVRSPNAARAALAPLLRPMLDVLSPEGGVAPSLGCKEELYRLLAELIAAHPDVVPPPVPAPPAPPVSGAPEAFPAALHAFWTALCRDVLLSVSSAISREVAEERVRVAQLAARKAPPGPLVLWPATPQSVAQASNDLLGALGRPRGLEALERLYTQRAPGMGVPGHGGRAAPPQGPVPPFRTANVMWDAPRAAIELLTALAALPGGDGVAWTQSAFHALHHLIPGSGAASQPLHSAYRTVRAALEEALGPQYMAGYPLAVPRPAAPPAPAAQEQLPPNPAPAATAVSEAPTAAPAPAAAPAPEQKETPSPQGLRIDVDQPLASLAALPLQSFAPVTALLSVANEVKNGTCVMAELIDFSDPGGDAVVCKLALGINTLGASRKALMSAAPQPGALLQAVRLNEVRVMRKAAAGKYAAALVATQATVVEVEPAGPRADALRRRKVRAPGVKAEPQSQQGECSVEQQRTASQTTRPAAPTPAGVRPGQKQLLDPVAAPLQAIARVVEMGYGEEAAETAVRAAKAEIRWREQSMDEFLGTVLLKLL